MRRQLWQPAHFLLDEAGGPSDTGKPNRHVIAEPIHRIVGSGGLDWRERKMRPLRELFGEQPGDKSLVDGRVEVGHGESLLRALTFREYARPGGPDR